ncbi:MAG: anthranilate phosphoribosyltransferase [Cyanobacteriota bacterium]|nr:anthranilate phosphoribosyltransferase [Cyanobacteriota bacterium]
MSTPSPTAAPSWPALLDQLLAGGDLAAPQAEALMAAWLDGAMDPLLTAGLLVALRAKGVNGDELAALARVLRAAAAPVARPEGPLVDTCGTGGDGADTFNISTAVAFTAAASGARVAKHGNRSASGRVGSADVLESLGLHLGAPLPRVVDALNTAGVTFLFAPGWHPALAGVASLRRTLGIRTVFNLLGPLVNPLQPDAQVLGVARADLLDPMAGALRGLGVRRAVVVHGAGGLDEASLSGPSELRWLEEGRIETRWLDPEALGLRLAPLSALAGGDRQANAALLEAVLRGQGSAAQRDVVALNTALVLWVAGLAPSAAAGLEQARRALESGAAWGKVEALRQALPVPSAGAE